MMYLSLPLRPTRSQPVRQAPLLQTVAGSVEARLNILFAEDNEVSILVGKGMLEKSGTVRQPVMGSARRGLNSLAQPSAFAGEGVL